MTLLIDPPNAAGHGRMWSHLASDTSYDELHAFALALGVPAGGFDGDHYDIPAEWHDKVLAAGAVAVTSRELIVRLSEAGLRVRKSTRMRPRKAGRLLLRPPKVSPGATVAVVSPAGPVAAARLASGVEVLERWGFAVHVPDRLGSAQFDWLADSDEDRAAAFMEAWLAPEVSVVWCARGGFGSQRILDLLDWRLMASAQPKWLVGFSDVTALHQAVASRLGLVTMHGPGAAGLDHAESADWVRALLTESEPRTVPASCGTPGSAEGPLVGGNLTMLASSLGTAFTHAAVGSIAVLEDIGERPYRLDRALTQLIRAGWFDGVRGILCGQFTDCGDPDLIEALLATRLGSLGVPILVDAPIGHDHPNLAVPLGVSASLVASDGPGERNQLSFHI